MRHYDVLYNQLHKFRYSYRSFLIDFSIAELQVVNASEDTHVNHPWLRLRPLQAVTSPRRSSSRSCSRSHVPLTLSLVPVGRKEGPYAHTDLTGTCTFIDRLHCAEPTNVFVERKYKKKKKDKNEERASERSRKTVTVVVDESQQSRVDERLNNTGETHANRDAKGTCRGSASGATSTTN